MHIKWRAHRAELGAKHPCEEEGRFASERDHVTDAVSIDCSFFREHDQTAKLVLIVRTKVSMDRGASCPEQRRPKRAGRKARCRHGATNGTAETYPSGVKAVVMELESDYVLIP